MRAAGSDVSRDLRELLDRHEDLVRAGELELEVVPGHLGDRLGLEAREAREAVILVDDDVPRAQVGEGPQGAASPLVGALAARALRALAPEEPVLGDDRDADAGRDEPVAQRGGREDELGLDEAVAARLALADPARLEPREVVGGAFALPAARPRDDGAVPPRTSFSSSGSASLSERAATSAACARNWIGWSAEIDESWMCARSSAAAIASGAT